MEFCKLPQEAQAKGNIIPQFHFKLTNTTYLVIRPILSRLLNNLQTLNWLGSYFWDQATRSAKTSCELEHIGFSRSLTAKSEKENAVTDSIPTSTSWTVMTRDQNPLMMTVTSIGHDVGSLCLNSWISSLDAIHTANTTHCYFILRVRYDKIAKL